MHNYNNRPDNRINQSCSLTRSDVRLIELKLRIMCVFLNLSLTEFKMKICGVFGVDVEVKALIIRGMWKILCLAR